ncbi:MAG TPA: 4-hydroxybenzoate octaprenyltransferase [Gammaproteobacteria bacterium]|nr:4-hydroxybenzoate octaprenyltransferase [Gammaproteobacteria bacterium]
MQNYALRRSSPFASWRAYARLMRLHRPIGTLLLLWPTLWALWIAARGVPDVFVLTVFVLGTLLMRSAGCVINDYADRHFDGHVRRTRDRPLAAGEIEPKHALALFVVLVLLSGLLVLTQNRLTIALAFAALALASAYPFMKRHTYLPQVWLGASFAWSVPMAFAAQTGTLPPLAWLLLSAVVLWVLVYDTQYAMVDREDDLKIGIKSTAILFDEADRHIIGALQCLLLLDLWLVGRQADLGAPYHAGLAVAAALAVYQQWLIKDRDPARCFRAFLNNNWLGLAVFAGIAVDYLR